MKVKIGERIYDSNDEPIMLILDETDKKNISNMHDDKFKFISHPKEMEPEVVRDWIDRIKYKEEFPVRFLKDLQEAFPNNKVEFGRGERILIDGKIVPGLLCDVPRTPYKDNLESVVELIKIMIKI
ncbi:MAG TPA: hypothetical protein VMZ91_15155 [Candidatus Paceibacterota bacterium]|nr:hypothetical protein [Candidatus Paceibacterota bacterium]